MFFRVRRQSCLTRLMASVSFEPGRKNWEKPDSSCDQTSCFALGQSLIRAFAAIGPCVRGAAKCAAARL